MRDISVYLCDFLFELKCSVLEEMKESTPAYVSQKLENDDQLRQLQSVAPDAPIDDYIEAKHALVSFETKYCYLRGMRDSKNPDVISPTGEEISEDISMHKEYKNRQAQYAQRHDELIAALPQEHHALLAEHDKLWNMILVLEKHYLYSGGMGDKRRLDEYFDPANTTGLDALVGLLL